MTRAAEEDEKAGRQEGKGAVGAATLRRRSAAALRLCAPAAGGGPALQPGAEFPHTGGGKRVLEMASKTVSDCIYRLGLRKIQRCPVNELLTKLFIHLRSFGEVCYLNAVPETRVGGLLRRRFCCVMQAKLPQQMFDLSFTCVSMRKLLTVMKKNVCPI